LQGVWSVHADGIAEGVTILVRLGEHGVGNFLAQESGESGLIGNHVEKAAADDDGALEGEEIEIAGEEDAAMEIEEVFEVIGDDDVVDDGVENFVNGAGRSEEGVAFEAIEHVGFGFVLPGALRLNRREIFLGRVIVDGGVWFEEKLAELFLAGFGILRVAPETGVGFEFWDDEVFFLVDFLRVYVTGEPKAGSGVGAPGIEMEEMVFEEGGADVMLGSEGAIEADDGVV